MRRVFILSRDTKAIERISASIKATGYEGKVEVVGSELTLLARIAELDEFRVAGVFVDLTSLSDGVRLVEWLKLSSRTREWLIIAIGEENKALGRFRKKWGAQTVLTKPLRAAGIKLAVANLNLAGEWDQESRLKVRMALAQAVTKSKQLREQQQTLARHIDLLKAELKDKKIPFRRKGTLERNEPEPTENRSSK